MLEHSSRLGVDPQPVGPLGLIAMDGCKPLGEKVNEYLVRWEKEPENADQVLLTYPGYQRESFLLDADCPRFSSGEGKAVLRQSVRGYDLYILCDVTNYSNTYRMYGMEVPMSPDDYFQDLKRIIAAEGKKAKRVPARGRPESAFPSSCPTSMRAVSTAAPRASPWTAPWPCRS